jgi:hypothetical protein
MRDERRHIRESNIRTYSDANIDNGGSAIKITPDMVHLYYETLKKKVSFGIVWGNNLNRGVR